MEKDNVIEILVKFSEMFSKFVSSTKKVLMNREVILSSVNEVKDYSVSLSLTDSELLDKSESQLREIVQDIKKNTELISENYFEFIMKEIGHDNPDYNGYFREDNDYINLVDSAIESVVQEKSLTDEYREQGRIYLKSFVSIIDTYTENFINKISSMKIFNNISRIQGNTVLIGANGSGKSTFARQLKKLHNDSISIISAQHLLFYQKSDTITYTEEPYLTIRDFQREDKLPMYQNSYDFQRQATEDFKNLVTSLINEYTQVAAKYYESDDKKNSILVDVINIWNSIVEHRRLIVDKLSINVQDLGTGEMYDFNRMSDGEKAIFYYIAHVLIALPSNYIVVDEPENHINLALCNLLWDKIEKVRQDCTFVYLTHNVDFAVSRINAQIFWNKSFTMPDSWEIIPIPKHTGIPDELLVEIAGSRKDVLFCEGDKGSWDYKLYSQLFEDKYTVLPVRGHLDVINYCSAYNSANLFHGHAVGIIDRDFHSEAQITSWERRNVHVLPFSEVENLMCTDLVFDHFKNISLITDEEVEEFKNAAFQDMERNIDQLVTIYVRDTLNNAFKNNMLVTKKDFENLKSEFENLINSMNIGQIRTEAKNDFSNIITERNYDKYLEKTNVKNKLIMEFAPRYLKIGDYPNRVLMQIQSNTELLERIKQEYFQGI